MEEDKIKYSDIIQPDGSIEKLIGQLEEFTKQYSTMTNAIRAGADRIVHAVRSASGATSEGRKSIDEAALATSRLERAQRELRIALSDTGKQIAWLKARTVDVNKATVEQQRYIRTAISSYDRLKADLKTAVSLYKSLTASERTNTEAGHEVLATILSLKREIAKLDAEMKPHIQTLSALEKAKQKLAFIQSEEGKQLLDIQAQIRAEIASRKEQKEVVSEVEKARRRLAQARSDENRQIKLYSLQTAEANQIAKLQAQIANSAEGSYNQLSAQYSLNKLKLNAMSAEQRNATESGKALEQETLQLYLQMQKLQEATGNYRLSVGHYQRAFNGLGFSVSQVVRELPSLAVSANTFFLAISNNIPLVVDEIIKLRAQNKLLQAEGKATVSVTGSIVKSLFSWNTALVVVLSVLSIFGKDIINWTKNITGANRRVIRLKDALKNIAKELSTTNASFGANAVKVKSLQAEWKNLKTVAEKDQWLRDNKSEFDALGIAVNNVADAENLFIKNTDVVIDALRLRAKAAAATKLASEAYEKALVKKNEAETKAAEYGTFDEDGNFIPSADTEEALAREERYAQLASKQIASSFSGYGASGGGYVTTAKVSQIEALAAEAKAAEATGDAYFDLAAGYEAAAKAELENAGIKAKHKKDKKDPEGRDLTDTIHRMALSVQKKYEQSITKLEQDEYAKREKEAKDTAAAKIRELEETYRKNEDYLNDEEDKYKELTSGEIALIQQAQEQIRKTIAYTQGQLTNELLTIEKERQISELEMVKETIRLRLQYVKEGTEEELRLRLLALDTEEQIALAKNWLLPAAQQQREATISGSFTRKRASATGSFELTSFDQQQALEEARFNEVKRGEREQSRFRLQQEKERWEKQISLAESGALGWTQAQIDAAKSTVIGIDRELSELDDVIANIGKKGLGTTLLESLGFDDDAIDALTQATNIVLENIQAILAAEVEAAQAAVDAAEERVTAAQKAYDAEIEARNNGYANSVSTAARELDQEKKKQREKEKILADAQRRQQRLDSIIQASSLITASANIWSSLSKIPIVGPALALAAIGTMWTSFAAAKIKAKQITASASEEYGEGGLEFLEGGSHASGNDIDLGITNKNKKRMRAEGGEAMAIINRKSTRRYRRVLPDIVDSLNKGVFEDKYLNAFSAIDNNSSTNVFLQNYSSPNLERLEKDVESIRKQNETRYFYGPSGQVIVVKGNIKRIIRQ